MKGQSPNNTILNYPSLDHKQKSQVHRRVGMMITFVIMAGKFIAGCVIGSGYLCVSALYSFLIALSKRKQLHYEALQEDSLSKAFAENGAMITAAGIVYSIYMARLLVYPSKGCWNPTLGTVVALCCFIDIGLAVRNLCMDDQDDENAALVLLRKTSGIASALPAFVFANIAITGFASEEDPSYAIGVLGIVTGVIMMMIGIGIVVYRSEFIYENERR